MSKRARELASKVALAGVIATGLSLVSSTNAYALGFTTYNERSQGFIEGMVDLSVSAGGDFAVWVKADGTAWFKGYDSHGQSGRGSSKVEYSTPVQIPSPSGKKIVRAFAGAWTVYLRAEDGTTYACGLNDYGQAGVGSTADLTVPTLIPGLMNVSDVQDIPTLDTYYYGDSTYDTSVTVCFRTDDNKLYRAGYNSSGGSTTTPVLIASNCKEMSATGGVVYSLGTDNGLRVYTVGKPSSVGFTSEGQLLASSIQKLSQHNNTTYAINASNQCIVLSNTGVATVKSGWGEISSYGIVKNSTNTTSLDYVIGTDGKLYKCSTSSRSVDSSISNPKELLGTSLGSFCLTTTGDLYFKGGMGYIGTTAWDNSSKYNSAWTKLYSGVTDIYPGASGCFMLMSNGTLQSFGRKVNVSSGKTTSATDITTSFITEQDKINAQVSDVDNWIRKIDADISTDPISATTVSDVASAQQAYDTWISKGGVDTGNARKLSITAVQNYINAENAIATAVANPTTQNISSAEALVPSTSPAYHTRLNNRISAIKSVNQALSDMKNSNYATMVKSTNTASGLVNSVSDPTKSTLSGRLNTVSAYIPKYKQAEDSVSSLTGLGEITSSNLATAKSYLSQATSSLSALDNSYANTKSLKASIDAVALKITNFEASSTSNAESLVSQLESAKTEELSLELNTLYNSAKQAVDNLLDTNSSKATLVDRYVVVGNYYTNKLKPAEDSLVSLEGVSLNTSNLEQVKTEYAKVSAKIGVLDSGTAKTTLLGRLSAIQSSITNLEAINEATSLTSMAESYLSEKTSAEILSAHRSALDKVNTLSDSSSKTDLISRLSAVKVYADKLALAEESVKSVQDLGAVTLENVSSVRDALTIAKEKVSVLDQSYTNSQALKTVLTSIEQEVVIKESGVEASSLVTQAVKDMKESVSSVMKNSYDSALEAVNNLPQSESSLKATLNSQLQGVLTYYNKYSALESSVNDVVSSVSTITVSNVLSIRKAYNNVLQDINSQLTEGYTNKQTLITSLTSVDTAIVSKETERAEQITQTELNATNKVNLAENLKTEDVTVNFTELGKAIDDAKTAISDLTLSDQPTINSLQSQVSTIESYYNRLIEAERLVVTAETTSPLSQDLVDQARTYIQDTSASPALDQSATNTNALLDRLHDVQGDIDDEIHDNTVAEVQVSLDSLLALQYTDVSLNFTALEQAITSTKSEIESKFVGDQYQLDKTTFLNKIKEVETYRGILLEASALVEKAKVTPITQASITTARDFISSSILKSDASNTKAMTDTLNLIQSALDNEVSKAEEALSKAESSFTQGDLDDAKALISALGSGTSKVDLTNKANDLQDKINKLPEILQTLLDAESSLDQGVLDSTNDFISSMPDGAKKQELVDKVTEIQDKINTSGTAQSTLDKAKDTLLQTDLDKANDIIATLPDGSRKQELIVEANKVQDFINKANAIDISLVEVGSSLNQSLLDKIKEDISTLPNGSRKDDLTQSANEVQSKIDKSNSIEQKLEEIRGSLDQSALDKVKEDVSSLPSGSRKDELNQIVNEIQASIDKANKIEQDLVEIQGSLNQEELDKAREEIATLPNGSRKDELSNTATAIQDKIDRVSDLDGALDKVESSLNQSELDTIKGDISDLPDGSRKDELNNRVDIIQDKIDKADIADSLIDKAKDSLKQDDLDKAKDYIDTLEPSDRKDSLLDEVKDLQGKIDMVLGELEELLNKKDGSLTPEQLDDIKQKVDSLPDGSKKEDLQSKLDELLEIEKNFSEVENNMSKAEETLLQGDLDRVINALPTLPDGERKENLKDRVEAVKNKIANLEGDATKSVEKVEQTNSKTDYDLADKLVSALPDSLVKDELRGRLDTVKNVMLGLVTDATLKVEEAEANPNRETIKEAQGYVDKLLGDYPEKESLQNRLDTLTSQLDAKDYEDLVKDAVEKLETSKNPDDIKHVQDLIDKLPEGALKDELQERLDKVIEDLGLDSMLDELEKTKDTELADKIQDLIDKLPDSNKKDEVQDRLDTIIGGIELESKVEQATKAVEKAEFDRTTISFNDAKKLVDALPESGTKQILLDRLANIIINNPLTDYTEQELKDILQNVINNIKVDNTTTEDILVTAITNNFVEQAGVSIKIIVKNFNKVNSTSTTVGNLDASIIGVVQIKDLDYIQIVSSVKSEINKLPPRPSGGSGGSGGSSSSSSNSSNSGSSSTTINDSALGSYISADFDMIGISRDEIASTVDVLNKEQTSDSANSLLGINGGVLNITKVSYLESVSTDQSKVNGTVQLINLNNNPVGIILTGDKAYSEDTVVKLETGANVADLHVYTFIEELGKFVSITPELSKDGDILNLRGTGKTKYVLSTVELDKSLLVDQNWNATEDGGWSYVKGQDVLSNWVTDSTQNKYYIDEVTLKMKDGWHQENSDWYYLNPISDGTRGAMKTGWQSTQTDWFYMSRDGKMQTGWLKDNNNWYYLNPISDGTKGAMKTGWLKDGADWYFLSEDGSMVTGTHNIDGQVYTFNSSGKLI